MAETSDNQPADVPGQPTQPAAPQGLSLLAVLTGVALLGLGLAAGLLLRGTGPAGRKEAAEETLPPAPKKSPELLARGKALYEKNCATCHGEKGRGDGHIAYLLRPRPRDFDGFELRLTSTSGPASDADLFRTLTRGMPGSAMPSWSHLDFDSRWALAYHVRHLARESRYERLVAAGMDKADAAKTADESVKPGAPVKLPKAPEKVTPELLAHGRHLFVAHCASCHDLDGRGRSRTDLKDNKGNLIRPRDFSRGVFKGPADAKSIATRLFAGVPGTPMPNFRETLKSGQDLWALAHYVLSLSPAGAQDRVTTERRTIPVARVKEFETDPQGASWNKVPATWIALMPLAWRDERPEGVLVRAQHDGERIAIHLTWDDPVADRGVIRQRMFGDSAATQISTDPEPPFFGMGSKKHPVSIWHWKACWDNDRKKRWDVEDEFPRLHVDRYDSLTKPPDGNHFKAGQYPADQIKSTWMTGWGAGNLMSAPKRLLACEELVAEGPGTITSLPEGSQVLDGFGFWEGGAWRVCQVRKLAAPAAGAASLAAGQEVSVAFAVWDGAAGDRNGQKSISIWHRLKLGK